MKVLYLDCSMGAAGDMLSAALFELLPERKRGSFVDQLNHLGLPGVTFRAEPAEKCGIVGTHMKVLVCGVAEESADYEGAYNPDSSFGLGECAPSYSHGQGEKRFRDHDDEVPDDHSDHAHQRAHHHDHQHAHHHEHRSLHDIEQIVSHLDVPEAVKEDVLAVYGLIAQAESHAHGRPVEEVHFHEVGSMDAVADVTAVCLLLHELAPDWVVASPVHVGSGQVHCVHGVLPVPAPATAWLLQGIPSYGGQIRGELCTPTGAALLKHFVHEFGSQPPMCVERIGYGCGQKDFETANCVRALLGNAVEVGDELASAFNVGATVGDGFGCKDSVPLQGSGSEGASAANASFDGDVGEKAAVRNCDDVLELRCNVDDMTPEALGFALEELLAAGALDAFTVPAGMKKSRPGTLLTCLCRADQHEQMVHLLFLHTTTLGVRETLCHRYILDRSIETVQTEYGPVRVKIASGWGVRRKKPEYEDLAHIARQQGLPLSQVREAVFAAVEDAAKVGNRGCSE